MKRHLLFVAVLSWTPAPWAQAPQTVDQLLDSVLQERPAEKQQDTEREQRFMKERDKQQALLAEVKAGLAAEEARAQALKAAYDANDREIADQRDALRSATGELGELHGVVRQIASDMKGLLESSLVSAQLPDRAAFADKLAQSQEMPSIGDLEKLWQVLLQETVESGRVVRFPTRIITAGGKEEERTVTRVGVFSAMADGRFLRYAPDVHRLIEPPKQPGALYQKMARELEASTSGITAVAFDPTRGAMLAILAQAPDLWTRINQGRAIGFLTMGLGLIAIVIAAQRYAVLWMTKRRVTRQLHEQEPDPDNPLGRVMKVYTDNRNVDTETLGLKLDEAILREVPAIQRGLGALVIIAEASPLLGLLGTVSGMISTFQALTMFGAGDAKVVAGGISEALVTTVIGLCVAIPTLLVHSVIKGKSDYLIQVLDEQGAGMVAQLAEAHMRQPATAPAAQRARTV